MFKALKGDLSQMYTQMKFLQCRMYHMKITTGVPVIHIDEYNQAVRDIFNYKVSGWWNYKDDILSLGLCSEEEFLENLKRN